MEREDARAEQRGALVAAGEQEEEQVGGDDVQQKPREGIDLEDSYGGTAGDVVIEREGRSQERRVIREIRSSADKRGSTEYRFHVARAVKGAIVHHRMEIVEMEAALEMTRPDAKPASNTRMGASNHSRRSLTRFSVGA